MSAIDRVGFPSARVWRLGALALALPVLIPIAAAAWSWTQVDPELFGHLRSHVLPAAVGNTVRLALAVLVGVVLVGTSTAALVALTDFPGRRFFTVALLLPLALPGYVLAVAFLGLFDYAAPLASQLRQWGVVLPPFRHGGGLTLVLTAALYPYVFLIAREAFVSVGLRNIEAARAFGMSPARAFFRAVLPTATPWISAGAALALMEVLADFGTVAAFGYDTLSVAIYRVWNSLFSPQGALQIASALLLFVFLLLAVEARARRGMRFETRGPQDARRTVLGRSRWLAFAWCGLVFFVAFALPAFWLCLQAWTHRSALADPRFLGWAGNSATLAGLAAVVITAAAALLATTAHARPGRGIALAQRVATLGYAFPGALLAVGLYVPVAQLLGWLNNGDNSPVVIGGIGLLLLGYSVRFLPVAHSPIHSGVRRIPSSSIEMARLFGLPGGGTLRRIYLPALRSSFAVAALLVFVDVMKEMPITLMMRPFGWDTLATRIFEYTSEGQWGLASVPAIALLLVGLLPILLLQRQTMRYSS